MLKKISPTGAIPGDCLICSITVPLLERTHLVQRLYTVDIRMTAHLCINIHVSIYFLTAMP